MCIRDRAYIYLKRYQEAEADASLALDLDPAHPKSLHRRGVARYYLKNLRAALNDLNRCLEISPSEGGVVAEIENIKKEIEKIRIEQINLMIEKGKYGAMSRVPVKVEEFNADESLLKFEEKRKQLEAELKQKPKKGLEDFLSDDENELDQLS
eukprot:TRINITY_DN19447_c0_g1_i2.p2 TRINITY_DN19447_c0_g1~~TRINITY_DN19447_c0_g1_i2.p2  ORF type:complete len:153 (-),score=40.34 TRINITY_DN19447_c0_g1_i2:166-624(-)